jgi:hypothetical protein
MHACLTTAATAELRSVQRFALFSLHFDNTEDAHTSGRAYAVETCRIVASLPVSELELTGRAEAATQPLTSKPLPQNAGALIGSS